MELKPFQKKVLNDLDEYLEYLQKYKKTNTAFDTYWKDKIGAYDEKQGTGMRPYQNNVHGVPNVCIKVPTGGGKTFIACNALKVLFDSFDVDKTKAVVWLVPSNSILEQTIKNLSSPSHPYRQKINTHFYNKVEVFTKEQLLQGVGFNPTTVKEQLSILVLSYQSMKSKTKEDRKVFQENAALGSFETDIDDEDVMSEVDKTALINVIRSLKPVLIVDESHNAITDLSLEMLKNLNPSFILDLTATPRENSNIISFTNAFALKKENMVKLPVIVYNNYDRTDVINSTLQLQKKLELVAQKEEKKSGNYIRPIVLFQAEPKKKDENIDFYALKEKLIRAGIPEDEIKIKTAKINEIKDIDLLSKECPVRYILTINALKEGWDCPFAYILASLANRSSAVDVEQLLGRVLRQPYVKKHTESMLNMSYVLTGSANFMETLDKIVAALNQAGFSEKDYKSVNPIEKTVPDAPADESQRQNELPFTPPEVNTDEPVTQSSSMDFDDINTEAISIINEENDLQTNAAVRHIEEEAIKQNEEYEQKMGNAARAVADVNLFSQKEIGKILPVFVREPFKKVISDIKLPQFFPESKDLISKFSESHIYKLEKENLLGGFELSKCDIQIDYNESQGDLFKIDLEKKDELEFVPALMKIDRKENPEFVKFILSRPRDEQITQLRGEITQRLGKLKSIPDEQIKKYLERILQDFTSEQVEDYLSRKYSYTELIKKKIQELANIYAEQQFNTLITLNKIVAQPSYQLPQTQEPGDLYQCNITKSLYSKEYYMNDFEKKAITEIASLSNVEFWTKNHHPKGFCINGFIHHYPDFIIGTTSGKIIIVETKGGDRDNTDSRTKARLGEQWQNAAGPNFKYLMVFNKIKPDKCYTLNDALDIIREL